MGGASGQNGVNRAETSSGVSGASATKPTGGAGPVYSWPTPETPSSLVPKMGELPVTSTAHFQTVAMTSRRLMPEDVEQRLIDSGPWGKVLGLSGMDRQTFHDRIFATAPATVGELVNRLKEAGLTPKVIGSSETVEQAVWRALGMATGPLDPLTAKEDAMTDPVEGVILYHEQGWYARGLALGNLLHSVALAPGEVTQVAMTHWNHTTKGSDSETDSQVDSASESDTQDRAVSEIQDASMAEHTSGGSSASSSSESQSSGQSSMDVTGRLGWASAEVTASGFSSSQGSSHSVSTSVSHSEGGRNLTMQANQNVTATTQRHAEAARTRRATVVREVSQSEDENITTRVLANYNHMHALTVMYFEVVEVFDLRTTVVDAERVIFMPFRVAPVKELATRFRGVLVDAARAAGKATWAQVLDDRSGRLSLSADERATIESNLREATASLRKAQRSLEWAIKAAEYQTEGAKQDAYAKETQAQFDRVLADYRSRHPEHATAALTSQMSLEVHGPNGNTYVSLKGMPEFDPVWARQAVETAWWNKWFGMFAEYRADFPDPNNPVMPAFPTKSIAELQDELAAAVTRQKSAEEAYKLVRKGGVDTIWAEIEDSRLYFNQAVWLSLSPGETLGLMRRIYRGALLSEQVDPAPVAVTGNYVGYRWRFPTREQAVMFKSQYIDVHGSAGGDAFHTVTSTLAVPTGGIFGEAVLGQAVSAEKIDLSRFWNWKDSMIPILPTQIGAIKPATPTVQDMDVKPTGITESAAKFGPLQDLPAPSGFNALAETMRAQIFKDMSGQEIVQTLAQATTTAAAQGSSEAAKTASANMMAGMNFVKDMAGLALQAATATQTGGATMIGGMALAKGKGGGDGASGVVDEISKGVSAIEGKPSPGGGGSKGKDETPASGDKVAAKTGGDSDGATDPNEERVI